MKPLQESRSNFNTPTVAAEDAKSLISSQSAPRTRTNSDDVVLDSGHAQVGRTEARDEYGAIGSGHWAA